MSDSLTFNNTITVPLKWELVGTRYGVTRYKFVPNPALILWLDQRDNQTLLTAENTQQHKDAIPSVSFKIQIETKIIECTALTRLRSAHWLIHGATVFKNTQYLEPNTLTFDGDWLADYPLHTQPTIPPGMNTTTTGASPRYGLRVAWANNGAVCVAQSQCLGAMPIMLRDPITLKLIKDSSIILGYNIDSNKVLGLPRTASGAFDGPAFGMKYDTNHGWEIKSAYDASIGSVYQWRMADLLEALATYCCMADYGDLMRKQIRGAGRSIRAVTDWLSVSSDEFCEIHLKKTWDYYESYSTDMFGFFRAKRIPLGKDFYAMAPFEWAQLCYGLHLASQYLGKTSTFIPVVLDWLNNFPGVPYEIQISDSNKVMMTMAWMIENERKLTLANPERYTTSYLAESYVFDWLRVQYGKAPKRPLNDPIYDKPWASPLYAGFHLKGIARKTYTLKGTKYTSLDEVKAEVKKIYAFYIDNWDGKDSAHFPDITVDVS